MPLKSFSDKVSFEKYLQNKNINHQYITYTKNYVIAEELFSLLEKKITDSYETPEIVKLNGLEIDSTIFHSELCTIPMFNDARLIWLKHADEILKTIHQDKTILSYFQRDFNNLSEKTFIIIQLDEAKIAKKLDFFTEKAVIFKEEKIKEKDFPNLIRNRVKVMKFNIEENAIQRIIEKSGSNASAIFSSLDKLFTYKFHNKRIQKENVNEVCHDIEADLYFKIINLIAERNINKILKMLLNYKIISGNILLSALAKLFTNAFRYRLLQKTGINTNDIHTQLKLNINNPYIYQKDKEKFYKMNHNYSLKEFNKIFTRIQRLDEQIKSTASLEAHRTFLIMFISSLA